MREGAAGYKIFRVSPLYKCYGSRVRPSDRPLLLDGTPSSSDHGLLAVTVYRLAAISTGAKQQEKVDSPLLAFSPRSTPVHRDFS